MSQRTVQILIGKLVTDEAFRNRFKEDRAGVVTAMEAIGSALTVIEREALLALDIDACEAFAMTLGQRTREWKSDLGTERPSDHFGRRFRHGGTQKMAPSTIAPNEDGFFINRLRRLLDVAQVEVEPQDLARFLLGPNTLLRNCSPWDLIMEPSDEEFECLLAGLRRKKEENGLAP